VRQSLVLDVTVRPAHRRDAGAITGLTRELGYPVDEEAVRSRLAAILDAGHQAVFVAEYGGVTVGWAHVTDVPKVQDEPGADLEGMVVAEQMRGRGVGRALVAAAEDWAGRRGLRTLRVRSRSTRKGAHAFYRRMGFEDVKTSRVFARRISPEGGEPRRT
jgi:GNAT superfamily N-acetyltransferase